MKKFICLIIGIILCSIAFANEKINDINDLYMRQILFNNKDLFYKININDRTKNINMIQVDNSKRNFIDINLSDILLGIFNINYSYSNTDSTLTRFTLKFSIVEIEKMFDYYNDTYFQDLIGVKYFGIKYTHLRKEYKEKSILSDFMSSKYWGYFVELGYISSESKKFSPPSLKTKDVIIPQIGIISGHNFRIYKSIFVNFEIGGGLCLPPIRLKLGLGGNF